MSELTNKCAGTLVSGEDCFRDAKSGQSYCWLHGFKFSLPVTSVPEVTKSQLKFLDEMSEEDLGNLEEYVEPEDTDSELFGYVVSTKVINRNKPVVLYFDWDGESQSCAIEFNGHLVRLKKYIYCDYIRNWVNKKTDMNVTASIGDSKLEFIIDSWDVLRLSEDIITAGDESLFEVRLIIDLTENADYNLIRIGMIETN